MEKVVKKYNSFEEADNAEREFWRNASVGFKFKTLEAIRYTYYNSLNHDIKGIEKVVKIRKLHEEEQD
ncbi:MAG TPA: hypothetical protein VLB50_13885 [Ignavibacteriaceae bacterium]|nr:hypothetical protein [Ignavibacteriaceae bacterium]